VEPPSRLSPLLLGETTPFFPSQPPALIFMPILPNHPHSGFGGERLPLQEPFLQQLPAVSSMQRAAVTAPSPRCPRQGHGCGRGRTASHAAAGRSVCPRCADVTPIAAAFQSSRGPLAAPDAFCRVCDGRSPPGVTP